MADKWKMPGYSFQDDTDLGADDALLGEESLGVVRHAQGEWQKAYEAGDQKGMDYWHGVAEGERKKAGYSGGTNGGGYIQLRDPVEEPDHGAPPEASSEFKGAMDDALRALRGQKAFHYDPETDPTYQQYKQTYTRMGKQAMEDTYGHAALRTGGLGGSAAISASQQAYNQHMAALADKVPELRQLAYQMWEDERARRLQDVELYRGLDQDQWGRYIDQMGLYNQEWQREEDQFRDRRDTAWNQGVDRFNMVGDILDRKEREEETEYQRGQDAKKWAWDEAGREHDWALDDYNKTLQEQQNALTIWKMTGTLDEAGAAVLGIPAGTKTSDQYFAEKELELSQMAAAQAKADGTPDRDWPAEQPAGKRLSSKDQFDGLKRTVDEFLKMGDASRAEEILNDNWDSLSEKQRVALKDMLLARGYEI